MTVSGLPAGQHTVRRHNQQLVLSALLEATGSRADLAARTRLTKATVSSLVDELLAAGVLHEGPPASSGPGRPSRPLTFSPFGPVAIGLEINVDYIAACVLDLSGRTVRHARAEVDNRDRSPASLLQDAASMTRRITDGLGRGVLGLALAVPGAVSPAGRVMRAPNLPRLAEIELADQADGALGRWAGSGVLIENEANVAALAWLRDRPRDEDFAYVSGEIGVGAGLVVGGGLFRGVNGFAGELGHVVVEADGPACGCGGQGCVEQYAGQDVLLASAGVGDVDGLSVAWACGEPRARAAVERAGSALGVGLASLLNAVDVPLVVLGGLYARLFDEIHPSLRAELHRRALSAPHHGGRLLRSGLGSEAAVLGAAGMVVEQALADPGRLSESVGS
ncbi:ROK family protein [Jatrophihabitans telluris]|uniref:ROK family protein n=1 Tax=Jatrophihabitans telluris TaxID=2038343 RepID=A0ABY4QZ96_9ACTN|nr:ROK family protein [Jatrophihabitans telluris]UQX88739.1 ROK family protein [Jatrophihabitans telluris]